MASKEEEQLKNELKARIDAENDNTEALRKARAVIDEQLKTTAELSSTTATVNAALVEYMQELKAANKTTRRAKEAFDEETIALDRLKKSLGSASTSLIGVIAVTRQEIIAAKKKVALYESELNVAKEALAIKTKLKNDLKQEIKDTSDAINASRARSEALEASRQLLLAERDAFAPSMAASEARTEALEASRQRLLAERDAFAPSMAASEARTEALEAIRPLLLEEAAALQDKIKVQTEAAEASKKASKQNINRLMSMDASYASEISEINKALTVLRTKNGTGKKLSDVEQSKIAELEAMKAAAQSNRAKNQAVVDSEIAARQQSSAELNALVIKQQQLASELDKNAESLAKESFDRLDLTNRFSVVESELEKNAEALAKESFDRLDLTNRFPVLQSEIEKNAEALAKESFDRMDLTDIMKNQLFPEYMAAVKAEKDLKKAVNDRTDKLNTAKDELTNLKVSAAAKIMTKVAEGMKKLAEAIDKLVTMIRELQQSFGITAGQAAKLKFDNLVSSVKSYTASILTLGKVVPVSIKEIEAAQKAFQDEFGGVITTRAATQLASEAKRMGVTTEQLAKARRVFMTSSMGNVGAANAAQNKFIAEFQKKGLTSKDAMLAVGQNSELLARNGSRFAVSFARAAADAKKIGVDLGKIDQVGDNIIGDFEGFLEKQAELGAMGFGFDTSRLAEVAETGDTGALMNELRSQLAATGKDITKLRRSEQLALSSAFGISMEELQRLAAPPGTEGSGEQLTDQQKSNKFLEKITNLLEGAKFALMGISITLGIIAARMLVFSKIPAFLSTAFSTALGTKLLSPITAISGRITALISKIPKVGNVALKTPGAMLRPFTAGPAGAIAGITGAISGFMTARGEGRSGTSSAGRGYVQGAAAAAGAVAGQALIPIPVVGALIGGFLGNVIGKGLNKMVPELGEGIGIAFKKVLAFFEPVKQAFARIGDSFKPLMDAFSKLSNVFNVEGREASKVAEVIGSGLAFFLKVGLLPLNLALQAIAGVIKFVIDGFTVLTNVVTALLSLLTFDWNKIKESFGNLGTSIMEMVGGVLTNTFSMFRTTIVAFFGDFGTSIMSSLSGVLSKIPFIGKFFATGDDIVSRAGYGQQTLVTPRGSVALNNRDTVVAYADDFTSSIMGGMQFFKKGALTDVLQSLPEMMKSMSLLTPLTMPLAPVMNTLAGTPSAPTAPSLNLLPFLRGATAQQASPATAGPAVSVDMSTLERKLDQVIGAISSMEVSMDGNKVGKVIAGSEQRASTTGVFRALR